MGYVVATAKYNTLVLKKEIKSLNKTYEKIANKKHS